MCSLKSHVVIPTALVLSQSFYLLRWHEREHPPRELVRSSARRGRGERQELPSQEAVREKQLGGGGGAVSGQRPGTPGDPGVLPTSPRSSKSLTQRRQIDENHPPGSPVGQRHWEGRAWGAPTAATSPGHVCLAAPLPLK